MLPTKEQDDRRIIVDVDATILTEVDMWSSTKYPVVEKINMIYQTIAPDPRKQIEQLYLQLIQEHSLWVWV